MNPIQLSKILDFHYMGAYSAVLHTVEFSLGVPVYQFAIQKTLRDVPFEITTSGDEYVLRCQRGFDARQEYVSPNFDDILTIVQSIGTGGRRV